MIKPVPIQISNDSDTPRTGHPVSLGIPFARGDLLELSKLQLEDSQGSHLPFHLTPLSFWSDGSYKWVLLDTQVNAEAHEQNEIYLLQSKDEKPLNDLEKVKGIEVNCSASMIKIDTGKAIFVLNKKNFNFFEQVYVAGVQQLSAQQSRWVSLVDSKGELLETSRITIDVEEEGANPLKRKVNVDGTFINKQGVRVADFSFGLTFFKGKSTVKCEFCLLNPHAAKHPGGVWDLGDQNSFFFSGLTLSSQLSGSENLNSSFRLYSDSDWKRVSGSQAQIYQDSSGGENWKSRNHLNHRDEVPVAFRGFKYSESGDTLESGERADPTVHLSQSSAISASAYIVDFWQNFPNSIEVSGNKLALHLFPSQFSDDFELQGGEQKTQVFYLNFGGCRTELEEFQNPILARLPLKNYAESRVFPWLSAVHQDTQIQHLIQRGLEGDNNFFEKREIIDEFGWRNFGEIYADHEALEYKGSEPLISHYNNQYDALYGLILQYLKTGDVRWRSIFSPLAEHIVDIDIYHTDEDRDEYNGGLFWHTHHYLTAFTCTHRTFSSRHSADFLYGEIGGGPGTEHCYTTGLCNYYYLTGDIRFKQAALQLAQWITGIFEGSGTVMERLLQFKSRDIPLLKRLYKGETIQRYLYPFTRGTGNYLTALIDAYNLTGEQLYLDKMDYVIYNTIHPGEDISLRNLNNIEETWSYLIFLQSICKYLELKVSYQLVDEPCYYARDCLILYADWMLTHESPFLEKPDNLEFPNETWTAQDLRKANILYIAANYNLPKKGLYIQKAKYFEHYVAQRLMSEKTRYYSRILIVLMQNSFLESSLSSKIPEVLSTTRKESTITNPPVYSITGIVIGFFQEIIERLFKFSYRAEKRWLGFRINS